MTPSDPGLARLELLREFKRRMPRADPDANVSPFDHRVSTAAGGPAGGDVADVHADVRAHVRDTIAAVREGRRQSQVILLSGAAGAGKTHLLRTFQTAEAVADLGHVFVGGSNHWRVGEFQARLLDWVVEALTAPSPSQDHPLLDRVRAIGFRAVEHLLANPVSWKAATTRPGRWWLNRVWERWRRPKFETLKALADARDPQVFAHFDYAAFSRYVCDRFLAERSNLLHRYALRVLLTYLYPDRHEDGVGTRERVLHWFRGRADDAYFTRRLGAAERPDRGYSQFEAVKLLAHLFSPAVSAQLSTEAAPCPPRVLLLAFDQAEGRDELFESEDDWHTFFAHLSELYNTLPNVVVLFTMTLGLRTRLHAAMERQFRDRIRMDERFVLQFPTPEQVLGLYRHRVAAWLQGDPELSRRYAAVADPYLPFTRDELTATAGNQTARDTLLALDTAFHRKVREVAVNAAIDYLFERNERRAAEDAATDLDYTADHLSTVGQLLDAVGPVLAADAGVEIQSITPAKLDNVPVLRLAIGLPKNAAVVTVSLARLGRNFNGPITSLVTEFLYNREKSRTFLWVVRPLPFPDSLDVVPERYRGQFSTGECGPAVESAFASLSVVAANRVKYLEPGQQEALDELIRAEVGATYLGRLLRQVREKLNVLAGGTVPSDDLQTTGFGHAEAIS